MAGIYQRMNPQLEASLDAALRNRQAYRDRQDARLRDSVGAFNQALPVFGRSIEMALDEDDPRVTSDPTYRAARFDYELSGDRSGLDAIRSRIAQEDAVKAQQAFTDAQRRASEAFQMSENDKNRAIQAKQNADNRTTEKARLLANIRTAQAIVNDARDNPSRYTPLDIAKANSDLELHHDLAEKSGWFTADEMRKIKGLPEPETPKPSVVPFKPGYVPEAAPAPVAQVPAEAAPAADWALVSPEVERLFNEAKTSKDIAAADARMKELEKDWGNSKEYEGLVATGNKNRDRVKKAEAAAAQKKARFDYAKKTKFSKSDVRKLLGIGKEGGGSKEAVQKFDYPFGKENLSGEGKWVTDGLGNATLYVDGKPAQTMDLY